MSNHNQWSPYNSYSWVVQTPDKRWFSVSKDLYDSVAQTMSWGIYTCEVDLFGKPTNVYPPSSIYIGGYVSASDDFGEFLPNRAVVDSIIQSYIESIPTE